MSSGSPTAAGAMPLSHGLQVGSTASAASAQTVQQTLVAQLDMAQVGMALRVGASDQALLGQWTGSLTLTIGSDGRIAHQQLALHGPSRTAGLPPFSLTHDVTYSQFNSASVAAPVLP